MTQTTNNAKNILSLYKFLNEKRRSWSTKPSFIGDPQKRKYNYYQVISVQKINYKNINNIK